MVGKLYSILPFYFFLNIKINSKRQCCNHNEEYLPKNVIIWVNISANKCVSERCCSNVNIEHQTEYSNA